MSGFIQYLDHLLVNHYVTNMELEHVFVQLWRTFIKIVPLFWAMVFGHYDVWMFLHWRLGYWAIERFVRSLMGTTITLGQLVIVLHHLSGCNRYLWMLYAYCVLEMRHMLNMFGWQTFCLNQVLNSDKLGWSNT